MTTTDHRPAPSPDAPAKPNAKLADSPLKAIGLIWALIAVAVTIFFLGFYSVKVTIMLIVLPAAVAIYVVANRKSRATAALRGIAAVSGAIAIVVGLFIINHVAHQDDAAASYQTTETGVDFGQTELDGSGEVETGTDDSVPGVDGSHPEAEVPEGNYPTADMTQDERLALWAELNPLDGSGPAEPSVDDSNEDWLNWVNHYIHDAVNPRVDTYVGPHKGEFWMSYGAVADPHGDLVAFQKLGSTETDTNAYIWGKTADHFESVWTGGPGDTERSLVTMVDTNYGETVDRAVVRMKIVEIEAGEIILASLAS